MEKEKVWYYYEGKSGFGQIQFDVKGKKRDNDDKSAIAAIKNMVKDLALVYREGDLDGTFTIVWKAVNDSSDIHPGDEAMVKRV